MKSLAEEITRYVSVYIEKIRIHLRRILRARNIGRKTMKLASQINMTEDLFPLKSMPRTQ